MSVSIKRVDGADGFEIKCDVCPDAIKVASIHELLYHLPSHLYDGHEELAQSATHEPLQDSTD